MPTFFVAPTANYISTSLNGAITDTDTTITLNSTANLQAPGYVVIDRTDAVGNSTPNAREVVSYTGISGSDLTGCTRGADGSTNRSHSNGAIVETTPTIGMWNSLTTIVAGGFDTNSYLKAINSPVSIARGEFTQIAVPSIASIAQAHITRLIGSAVTITTSVNMSGASIVGIASGTGGLNAVFQVPGSLASQANVGGFLLVPTSFTASFINAAVLTPASLASVGVHILKNGSVFGVCEILAAATFASSASISNTALVAGDRLTLDIRSTASIAGELSVLLRAT